MTPLSLSKDYNFLVIFVTKLKAPDTKEFSSIEKIITQNNLCILAGRSYFYFKL